MDTGQRRPYNRIVNLNYYKTFIMVSELGSFSHAAERLGITQPAVSFQIQALEKSYGEVLIDRSGATIKLTEAGEIFLEHATEITETNEALLEALSELRDLVRGTLEIGASNIPGEYVLPRLLGEFKETYPDIRVRLEVADTGDILHRLLTHDLDIGFIGSFPDRTPLKAMRVATDRLVCAMPPNHALASRKKLSLRDLMNYGLVLRETGSGTRRTLEQALAQKERSLEDANVVMELGSTQAVLSAVAGGLGITVVSSFATADHVAAGTILVRDFPDLDLVRDLYVAFNEKTPLSRAQDAFLDFIEERSPLA